MPPHATDAELPRADEPTSIWGRPPLLWVRLGYLSLLNRAFSLAYRIVRSNYWLWARSSQHYGGIHDRLAHLHAYLMCAWAKRRVPAYGQFLAERGHRFKLLSLSGFPETSKESYASRYGFAERCRNGRIPIAGTVVDESAGSSGTPHNWVRSGEELRDVHVNTANWIRYTYPRAAG